MNTFCRQWRYFFRGLKLSNFVFVFIISLIPLFIYIVVAFLIKSKFYLLCNKENESFWLNTIAIFLGFVLTIFVGFWINLKLSTNNIVELLVEINKILKNADTTNKIYIILPTPFLGFFYYKKYYKSFELFFKNHQNYKVAYLNNHNKNTNKIKFFLINNFNNTKTRLEARCKSRFSKRSHNRKIVSKSKEKAWKSFIRQKNYYVDVKDHLLAFHIDELTYASKKNDADKYDYIIALCNFIEEIEKKLDNYNYLHIPYHFKSTVFPIIVMDTERKDLLHGTVAVESQSVVRFTGELLENADLCEEAEKIYNAYCETCGK